MDESCKTKYPIMLVHGTGFRDLALPLYWGRIPRALAERGAQIHYGMQDGWGSTASNAARIAERIREVLAQTGAEKINLIGHSKGGLEIRMAASALGMGDKIASVTTLATPHRGSRTMDRLLKAPQKLFNLAAFAVNNWIRAFGDREPDFVTVCREFSTGHMARFNLENPDHPAVYYQSYACLMRGPASDANLAAANFVISLVEGENDGLVSVESARWGENFTVLRAAGRRGISHLDEVDFRRLPLSRKKTPGRVSDIVEAYIEIVSGLKQKGF
ncbi:MAG TPA: alpha/beta fold hydrolase [Clostridia bacterium]|nr:alpha/beta fold hydrolase [Clostridia bacterium]HPK14500.1 alpha/beta fold hydrolase [Clostridia bacterium]